MAEMKFMKMFGSLVLFIRILGISIPNSFEDSFVYLLYPSSFVIYFMVYAYDAFSMAFSRETQLVDLKFHCICIGSACCYVIGPCVYYLQHRRLICDLYAMWTDQLQPVLLLHKKEKIIGDCIPKILQIMWICAIVMTLTFISIMAMKIYLNELYFPSTFSKSVHTLEDTIWNVLFQGFGTVFWSIQCSGLNGMVTLFLYSIIIEIRYLHELLNYSFARRDASIIKRHLQLWIKHHQSFLRYFHMVNSLIAPMMVWQYINASYTLIGMIYAFTVLETNLVLNFLSFATAALIALYTYNLSYLGHQVMEKNYELWMSTFDDYYTRGPLDVQRSLIIIRRALEKPLRINMKQLINASLETFGNFAVWEYRLFTVLQNTH